MTTTPFETAARFDSPDFYLGDPNATFKELRRVEPVYWSAADEMWVITKYDDIKAISSDPERFRSERIAVLMDVIAKRKGEDPQNYGNRGVMFMDPPEHRSHRRAIGAHLTPGEVAKMEDRVREVVKNVVDGLPDGEFDFIEHVAEPVPVQVFAQLLGIPEKDWSRVVGWATTIAHVGSGAASDDDMTLIYSEVAPFIMELVAERREAPQNDFLTMLTTVLVDGQPLDEVQVLTYALILLAAGSETTQSLIAGLAHCIDEFDDQRQLLFDDPSRSGDAVEETMRFWTPVMSMARQAAVDVELRGKTIKAGDAVLLAYASANRDEERWGPTADEFDITRRDARTHLGFGIGEHFCMGAALARREARLLIDELVERTNGIRITGEAQLRASALVHTYDRLPVTLDRR
ncbi:cytochrome P450 [uncultured Williamsia sp.]|uniref:cytochrome P450 n=1 Tax=uncultured Williamsia sp. TaxID=259311 RepID=UPI002601FD97|nr:cytochrome P450 [uncultured Williamsia sp.]